MDGKDFVLNQAFGFHVNRTAHLMSEEIARRFSAAGHPVSAQDFGILYRLREQGPLTQKQIAATMRRDKTTITRRLDGLARKGLIERRPHPDDRRCCLVALTAQGLRTLDDIIPLVADFQREVLDGVPEADREATIRTLRHVANMLTHSTPAKKETP